MFQETFRPYMQPLYDKFFSEEQAFYLKDLFEVNGLHPFVQAPMEVFNVATGANTADLYFTLHLPQEEFAKADELIYEEVKKTGIPSDYHLRNFNNQELNEIIAKPDQWSKQDIAVARILLAEKNIEVNYETVAAKSEERYLELNKKIHISPWAIITLCLLSFIGYPLTIFAGPIFYFMKNTDFNGKKQYVFSEETRKQGILLFLLNALILFIVFSRYLKTIFN